MNGLNAEQEREYRYHKGVDAFFAGKPTQVASSKMLKKWVASHLGETKLFETMISGKSASGVDTTKDKDAAKLAVANYYEPICKVTYGFCIDGTNGVSALAGNFKFSSASIFGLNDGEIKGFTDNVNAVIENKLMPILAYSDAEITLAMLLAGAGLSQKFTDFIGGAGSIDAGVTAVIKELDTQLTKMAVPLVQIELAMSPFKTSDVTFFDAFEAVNKIDNVGVLHNNIKGNVTKGGEPVENAKITCTKYPKKTAVTDVVGDYMITKIIPDTYEFTCVHPIFGVLKQIVTVLKKKTITVNWEYL